MPITSAVLMLASGLLQNQVADPLPSPREIVWMRQHPAPAALPATPVKELASLELGADFHRALWRGNDAPRGEALQVAAHHPSSRVSDLAAPLAGSASPVAPIIRVEVDKSERRLSLVSQQGVIRSYRVSLGEHPEGSKTRQGDSRTPEGDYLLDWRNPDSRYHKAIHVSYPNARDRQRGATGGDIMLHAYPDGLEVYGFAFDALDWTEGCIALSNGNLEEVWRTVPDRTPIAIRP